MCNKSENVTPKTRGNSQAYRIAKLKRDHPEVTKRLENGEFKSVSEAEREAGIGRKLLTYLDKVVNAFNRLSDKDRQLFLLQITGE